MNFSFKQMEKDLSGKILD